MARRAHIASIGVAVLALAACSDDPRTGVELPGVDGAPSDVTVPEAPPLPTTTAPPPPPATTAPTPATDAADEGDAAGESASDVEATDAADEAADAGSDGADAPATTAAPAPTTTEEPVEDIFLRRGDEGPEVRSMQERLIALDFLVEGGANGVFDAPTAAALIDFQSEYGLVVDGIYGPQSDRALNAAAASVGDG